MAGRAFWYKLMDLMHYGHLNLTSPVRGYMVFNKRDWARRFYDGEESSRSDRAWERFKVEARGERLFCSLPGDEDEVPTLISDRVVLRVSQANDALYVALGPPHPGGLKAQVRCERERRQSLLPLVVRGIAAAARVEQHRRMVG